MSINVISKLTKQFSMYFSSNFLITLAGLISYPIWTRVFSTAEYGQMSLATITLSIFIVLSKFGIQHAALRFYSEFKAHKRDLDITYYYTTSFISVLFFCIMIAIGFIFVIEIVLGPRWDIQYLQILRIVALLIIFDSINSIFFMFLRAEQNVKLRTILKISHRYLTIGASILFAIVLKFGLVGFFIGWALIDGLYSIILILIFLRHGKIKLESISIPLLKEALSYGLPLIGFELSSILLSTGDRYVLQFLLGSTAVGLYSSAYNLTSYLVDFFAVPFRMTIMPIYMSTWEKKGKEQTQQFLSSVFKFYCMIAIPIVFAISFIGRDFLGLLASKKFVDGHVIMPYVIIGLALFKANSVYAAGMYLKKKTKMLLIIQISSAVLNIALNFVLIPYFGLLGAAIATLAAYSFQVILVVNISSKIVKFQFPFYAIVKYVIISIIMVVVIMSINNFNSAQTFVRVIAGFLTYCAGILLVETEVRKKASIMINKIFA